jgi:hypothetical protein
VLGGVLGGGAFAQLDPQLPGLYRRFGGELLGAAQPFLEGSLTKLCHFVTARL